MNEEYLERVLDEISDEKIQKAAFYPKKKRAFLFRLIAASLAVIAVGAFAASKIDIFKPVGEPSTSAAAYSAGETGKAQFGESEWKKLPIYDRYDEITLKSGKTYSFMYTPTSLAKEGKKAFLETTNVTGYNGNVAKHTTAEVYSIAAFSPDAVVAVKFRGNDEYYLYLCDSYNPETLKSFLNDIDFENSVKCRGVSFVTEQDEENTYTYEFSSKIKKEGEVFSALLDLFNTHGEKKPEKLKTAEHKKTFELYFSTNSLGEFWAEISDDGYVEFKSDAATETIIFKFTENEIKPLFDILEKDAVKTDVHEQTTPPYEAEENETSSKPFGFEVVTTEGYSEVKTETAPAFDPSWVE